MTSKNIKPKIDNTRVTKKPLPVFKPVDTTQPFPGLITREKQPVNLEFPFSTLQNRIIPDNLFYIRNHFSVPEIKASQWKLTISGEVTNEVEISYDDLIALPPVTIMATLECAGNGRSYLVPKAEGLLWEQGGIGTAEWTGVSLSVLLKKAGIKRNVIEIILEGADFGIVPDPPKSPGAITFARSISLDKAMQKEVMLVYKMNGKALIQEHGFPVRAIVPGYYGMSSVKWLSKIIATATLYNGYWQTLEYAYWERKNKLPVLTPVATVLVKSSISRPALHETVSAGSEYTITGAGWSGDSEVVKVEVSTDGGTSWNEALLLERHIPFVWRLWEFLWEVPKKAGTYKLLARATDKAGNQQPAFHIADKRTYMINHIIPLEVTVE